MTRFLPWILLSVPVSAAFAHADPLVIDGLQPGYADVSEVKVWIRNTAGVRVWLDSFNLDRIDVERQVEGSGEWVRRCGFRCGNAGAGSPQSLPPGGSLEVRLLSLDAFAEDEARQSFQADTGAPHPLPGRYRIRVSYSVERWASMAEIPKNIETVVSAVFEVKSRGR